MVLEWGESLAAAGRTQHRHVQPPPHRRSYAEPPAMDDRRRGPMPEKRSSVQGRSLRRRCQGCYRSRPRRGLGLDLQFAVIQWRLPRLECRVHVVCPPFHAGLSLAATPPHRHCIKAVIAITASQGQARPDPLECDSHAPSESRHRIAIKAIGGYLIVSAIERPISTTTACCYS